MLECGGKSLDIRFETVSVWGGDVLDRAVVGFVSPDVFLSRPRTDVCAVYLMADDLVSLSNAGRACHRPGFMDPIEITLLPLVAAARAFLDPAVDQVGMTSRDNHRGSTCRFGVGFD